VAFDLLADFFDWVFCELARNDDAGWQNWRFEFKTISKKLAEVEIKSSETGHEPDVPKPDSKGK
jgi:hypothetical protein